MTVSGSMLHSYNICEPVKFNQDSYTVRWSRAVLKSITRALLYGGLEMRIAIKRHNGTQTWNMSKESLEYITSQWILSIVSRPLCIFIVIHVTSSAHEKNSIFDHIVD